MWPRTQWDHLLCYIVENFTKEKLDILISKKERERERRRCPRKRRDEFLVQASLIVGCQKQFFFFFYQVARNMYGPSNKVKKRGLGDLFTTKNLNVIANLLLLFSSWLKTSFLIIKKKLNTFSLIYRGHLQNENLEAAIKWFSRKTEKGQDDFLVELTIINCLHRKQIWYTSKVDYFCEPN